MASFVRGTNVTELSLSPEKWGLNQTVYFWLDTNAIPLAVGARVSNVFTLRALGALYDQVQVSVGVVPTNGLGLLVEASAFKLAEGTSRSFKVSLSQPPMADVQVTTAMTLAASGLSILPSQLTFTPQNWSNQQPVTVSSALGEQLGEFPARFSLSASGGLVMTQFVDVTLLGGGTGGLAVYALRDDLGEVPGSGGLRYSEPFVIVTYTDGLGQPTNKVFQVVEGDFTYPGTAGRMIQPPYPLSSFLGWEVPSYATNSPAAWEDRKQYWWARSGPDDGGTNPVPIVMKFYYPQNDTYFFPPGTRPAGANWVPWLDRRFVRPTPGILLDVTYRIVWPTDVPKLLVGESLIKAKFGLPSIKGQTSVDILYEQAEKQGCGAGSSIKLIDPTYTYSAPLDPLPEDTQGKTVTSLVSVDNIPPKPPVATLPP